MEEMVKVREGCSWLLCYLGVFSSDTSGFGWGRAEGLGSAPLLLWFSTLEGRQAVLAVGRTCPSAEFCLLLPSPAVSQALPVGAAIVLGSD